MKLQPEWWVPTAWPLFWRRAFFITLPVSGPIWLALTVIGHVGATIFIIVVALPVMCVCNLWEALWERRQNETH